MSNIDSRNLEEALMAAEMGADDQWFHISTTILLTHILNTLRIANGGDELQMIDPADLIPKPLLE